jgi:hypothetical protein
MVDFSKLVGGPTPPDSHDPLKIFESLDRKASHATLRPAQIEALTKLRDRRAERDLVLKLGTGVGKSTVGLLYLRSYMNETKEAGVYLCPTRQLVMQVLDEADKLGIRAFEYPRKEPHPNPACLAGSAVLVCTYSKLFNGKSTFDRTDVRLSPCAIVLDDAHTGIEEVRREFTLRCSDPTLVQPLLAMLAPAFASYSLGWWEAMMAGQRDATLELPYWLWESLVPTVERFFIANADHPETKFPWPHLRNRLRWCRCVVSASAVEIMPWVIPADAARAYAVSKHRLFMSGTLADEAILVRELGSGASAAKAPIIAGADVGLGERMVLAPTLLDPGLGRDYAMAIGKAAANHCRVVVLCHSERRAREWETHGATVVVKDEVADVVESLRSGEIKFAAFAQRYDGVDLPDDACRLLIIDGMPFGEGLIDRHDSAHMFTYGGARNRLVLRIEQGMGRAIRSPADYAVVLLAGPDLASFTAKTEVRNLMSADARAQLSLALELADIARRDGGTSMSDAVWDMLWKCLNRDPGWKRYYDERVRRIVAPPERRSTDAEVAIAEAEQRAASLASHNDAVGAAQVITEVVSAHVGDDDGLRGQLLQEKANYLHTSSPAAALELQKQAHAKNRALFRPPQGVVLRAADSSRTTTAAAIIRWYGDYASPNGAIAEFQVIRARCSFASTFRQFEQALCDLAPLLGAVGERKDPGGGPDNLILWANLSLVIEAKNEARYDRIPKKDAEQLLHAVQWFKVNYPHRTAIPMVPVMAVRTTQTENQVFLPDGSRLLLPDGLANLLNAIERFLGALVQRTAAAWTEKEVAALLTQHGVAPEQIVGRYTVAPGTLIAALPPTGAPQTTVAAPTTSAPPPAGPPPPAAAAPAAGAAREPSPAK